MDDTDDDPDPIPLEGPEELSVLRTALGEGDPQKVRALLEAGKDIHYRRQHGYDALLDAVHGRDVQGDPRLLELLRLLIEHKINLSGVSSYGESGLGVLSRWGRFDAVGLLLAAGANRSLLGWSSLHEAVALGSLEDVRACLDRGANMEARDSGSRTPLLLATLTGDLARVQFLRDHGADLTASGHCDRPPLFYAIQGRHPDMVRWMLEQGAQVNQTDQFGTTALIEAVERNDLACVEILLAAGAEVEANANGTALHRARSREIALRLLEAGANPADLPCEGQRIVLGLPSADGNALSAVSPENFRNAFTRTFGQTNPERMQFPFWEAMLHSGVSAYEARQRFEENCRTLEEAVWCAQRFGQSLTLLPDGRAVQIGGEHEDFYDPDFCIYNDVFVWERDGSVAIYGYPEGVFPPTDFHTATQVGDCIYVIGSLGYQGTRTFGETPVYRLDLHTMRMDRLEATGEAPGWIYRHRAVALSPHAIRVWSGKVARCNENGECHEPNLATFVLDLEQMTWRRE